MERYLNYRVIVDVSNMNDQQGVANEVVNHWYHNESKQAQADMYKVFKGMLPEYMEATRLRLSDGRYVLKG